MNLHDSQNNEQSYMIILQNNLRVLTDTGSTTLFVKSLINQKISFGRQYQGAPKLSPIIMAIIFFSILFLDLTI